MAFINLDHNATAPLLAEAAEAMRAAPGGNPASAHQAGRRARKALEESRERIASLLGAEVDEVVFTSGATEANNLAIFGRLTLQPLSPGGRGGHSSAPPPAGEGWANDRVAASHLEHPCVVEPLKQLEARGVAVEWRPVDARGRFVVGGTGNLTPSPRPLPRKAGGEGEEGLAPGATGDARGKSPALVCLMLANHETGAVQPVREVASALPEGAMLHCDAAQAAGKIPVNFGELGATTLAISAHKFGGPAGVGALIVRRGTKLRPLLHGGHQQRGRRPGTEPVALVMGMAAALEYRVRNLAADRMKLEALRDRLWRQLSEGAGPAVLNGPEIGAADVVPGTLNVSFPGCRGDVLLMALDLADVACSTGSACSSGSLLPSPVLTAMGVPDEILRSALRFSFGPETGFEELDEAAARVSSVVKRARDPRSRLV